MFPTAAQVDELCTELKLLGQLEPNVKLHVRCRTLQPAYHWLTRFWRALGSEDYKGTIKHVKDKVSRAIECCEVLQTRLDLPTHQDHFRMIRDDLAGCIVADKGLHALRKTYEDDHEAQAVADLSQQIRKIELRLEHYRQVLPAAENLAVPWTGFFNSPVPTSSSIPAPAGTIPSPLLLPETASPPGN